MSVGTEAEILVRYLNPERDPPPSGTMGDFFDWLERQPRGMGTAEEDQALLRQMRDEWD